MSEALAIDGVVGPPGVGADAGVDADGVEPDACGWEGPAFEIMVPRLECMDDSKHFSVVDVVIPFSWR